MRAEDVLSSDTTFLWMSWNQRGSRPSREAEIIRDRATQGCLWIFYEVKFIGFLFSILSHLTWLMSSTELSAGALPEYQPSLYVIHSPEGGSTSDATSDHTRTQSIVNTGISTSDNRKGNDQKTSVSSVKAVREKGTSKNRAISTPRPLQIFT